jgi:hypothetical protein
MVCARHLCAAKRSTAGVQPSQPQRLVPAINKAGQQPAKNLDRLAMHIEQRVELTGRNAFECRYCQSGQPFDLAQLDGLNLPPPVAAR